MNDELYHLHSERQELCIAVVVNDILTMFRVVAEEVVKSVPETKAHALCA
ncbi:hypothetical protein T06_4614 [Trichinella sp. T6]|nr:hypothetical protein T06_3796 [Trichinella sp. T6]KRX69899.1 hypothetical protein T06_4614 [Trichinella sp. T6]KRZ82792.1 hypothetical protein T08_585 [Trichinella sp. T8]KRZ82793.1 hypothetical protein T08_1433 [Trichinella sp. T8]